MNLLTLAMALYWRFCLSRVTNNRHMYDATEIFRTLSVHKKECFIKLAFYLLVSFNRWTYHISFSPVY